MSHELCATVGDSERALRIERTESGEFRVVDGAGERVVDAREIRPGTWSLIIDGRSWVVDLDNRRAGTVVLVAGTETPVALEDARRKRLAEAVAGGASQVSGEQLRAPIAGKVVKVLVDKGASVAPGDSVVVLETMKMENEIRSAAGGVVDAIHVEAGQSVETQEILVTLR